MHRRDVIKFLGMFPWLLRTLPKAHAAAISKGGRILILLELKGGNDGLNMFIPYADSKYYDLRPNLAIARDSVIQVTDQLGFNPKLAPLLDMWQSDAMAVVQSVGYPEPNRSHFRSIEIWETGSHSEEYLSDGWLARLLAANQSPSSSIPDGIVLGNNIGPLGGRALNVVALRNIRQFFRQSHRYQSAASKSDNPALQHILNTQKRSFEAAKALKRILLRIPTTGASFPKTRLGQSLNICHRLISADAGVSVYKISHHQYDTHANQRSTHDRLLGQLADGLAAFCLALKNSGWWHRVLVMTYSEFGRRVAENGSRGTDHGTASPHLFMGGRVRGGIYGRPASLTDLANGDLKYHIDFRSLYMTVARNWWRLQTDFLNGRKFPTIDCVS